MGRQKTVLNRGVVPMKKNKGIISTNANDRPGEIFATNDGQRTTDIDLDDDDYSDDSDTAVVTKPRTGKRLSNIDLDTGRGERNIFPYRKLDKKKKSVASY